MRRIIITLLEISVIIVTLTIFLFVLVDCKMENVELKTKYDILNDRVTDLEKELAGIRQVYSMTLITLIQNNKTSLDELSTQLPEHEYNYLQMVLLTQETGDSRQ